MQLEIGHDHLTRAKPSAVNDVVRIHIDETSLGTRNDKALVVERKSTRPQSVAIQDCSDLVPVCKSECRRAIPRFDAIAAVLQERRTISWVGGWHYHADCLRDGAAAMGQQFHNLIERG